MKNKYLRLLSLSLLSVVLTGPAHGQDWDPVLTERWEPVPVVVTPGQGAHAPSDAIVLFDGTSLSEWKSMRGGPAKWRIEDGAMTVVPRSGGIHTRQSFGSIQLHLEWRTPAAIAGEGQGRGNSGVFFQDRYEVQVLDSYENRTYSNGQAGSVYKQHIPLVNASKGPGEWQSYDIIYTVPVFGEDGELIRPAYVTVIHNGILIQNHVELKGPTEYIGLPEYKPHGDASLMLQNHGNPVSFRNIWVRDL